MREEWIRPIKWIKDIFFVDHHLRVDHGLAHYKSQSSEHQLHKEWNFSYFLRFGKDHSRLDNWHPNLLSMLCKAHSREEKKKKQRNKMWKGQSLKYQNFSHNLCTKVTHHRIGFSRSSLSVGKYTNIIPIQNRSYQWPSV